MSLKDVLNYDPETGVFTWRKKLGGRAVVGRVAGTYTKGGYLQIRTGGKHYYGHRLAWFLMTGQWPKDQIDHIDGNKKNNKFSNLREASTAQNTRNQKRKGVRLKGVGLVAGKHYTAGITVNYKQIYLGIFKTEQEAHQAYLKAAEKYFGEFARAE